MFQPGDFIIYGSNGVCEVTDIGTPEQFADRKDLYYKLEPVYSSETIYTPVGSRVFMRPVMSRDEAELLIAKIPSIETDVCTSHKITFLKAHYESSLETHKCEDLIQLIKSVYVKNVEATHNGKKLGQIDQRYMKRAEELLHGELAVALGISCNEVANYIEDAVVNTNSRMKQEPIVKGA